MGRNQEDRQFVGLQNLTIPSCFSGKSVEKLNSIGPKRANYFYNMEIYTIDQLIMRLALAEVRDGMLAEQWLMETLNLSRDSSTVQNVINDIRRKQDEYVRSLFWRVALDCLKVLLF